MNETPKVILFSRIFYIAFSILGGYQFINTFYSDYPLPFENSIMPLLCSIAVIVTFIKKNWARYFVSCLSLLFVLVIMVLTYFFSDYELFSPATAFLVLVIATLLAIGVTFILNNGVKNYYGN